MKLLCSRGGSPELLLQAAIGSRQPCLPISILCLMSSFLTTDSNIAACTAMLRSCYFLRRKQPAPGFSRQARFVSRLVRYGRADAVVVTKRTQGQSNLPAYLLSQLDSHAIPMFSGELVPTALVQVLHGQWLEQPLSALSGKRVIAVTAVANPQPFYHSIREQGAELTQVVEFPDHHSYTHSDWQQLVQDSGSCDVLLTTEKDLVKLERFSPAIDRLRALRVQLQLEPAEAFLTTIEQQLRSRKRDRTDNGRTISHQSSH